MLIKCPECHKEISDQAESCPHCGYPIKKKEIEKDDNLVSLVARGSRGYQTFIMTIAIIFIVIGINLLVTLIVLAIYNYEYLIRTIIFIISQVLLGTGVAITIYLSIVLAKNKHISKDIVYYDKENEEFIFYPINGREIRINKKESFTLYNNAKNLGELRLRYSKARSLFLGFTYEKIEVIHERVYQYKNTKKHRS